MNDALVGQRISQQFPKLHRVGSIPTEGTNITIISERMLS